MDEISADPRRPRDHDSDDAKQDEKGGDEEADNGVDQIVHRDCLCQCVV